MTDKEQIKSADPYWSANDIYAQNYKQKITQKDNQEDDLEEGRQLVDETIAKRSSRPIYSLNMEPVRSLAETLNNSLEREKDDKDRIEFYMHNIEKLVNAMEKYILSMSS